MPIKKRNRNNLAGATPEQLRRYPNQTFGTGFRFKPIKREIKVVLPATKNHFNPLHSIGFVATKNSQVGHLFGQVKRIKWLDDKIKNEIGLPLAAQVDLVRVEGETAVLLARSAALAQRTQFVRDQILRILKHYCGPEIKKVKVQVKRHG